MLSLLVNVAEDAEVGVSDADCKDETNKKLPCSKNSNGATSYLIPNAKQTFIQLRQTFIKAPILHHFDPECHIWIKTDALGYTIGEVLSQLTLNNLGK